MDAAMSDQSESMGRSDGEEEVPMKAPADDGAVGGENDESFLDEDFLSFSNADNGGETGGLGGQLSGRKRGHSSMTANGNSGYPTQRNTPRIPWLDDTTNPPPPPPTPHSEGKRRMHRPQQQQHQWGLNRGYGGGLNRNQYYTPPPPRAPPLIRLHNEIVSFVKLMSPTKGELAARDRMVERVTKLAHRIFGGEKKVDVLPFGSQVTGLCLPGSDIDFVIRFKEKGSNGKSEEEENFTSTGNPLHRFADAVRNEFGFRTEDDEDEAGEEEDGDDDSEHLSYLEVIEQTRVPLVKFTVAPYNIDVDVCFDQPNGPESAELMHRFMESMPPLRPLAFVLKYFLASREINKPFTGGIGSYLLQLMIVSYLQQRAREDVARRVGAGGKHFNLGSLLLDFFELYGIDFNYVTTGISVRHDGRYFPKGGEKHKESFWQPSKPFSLAMENPFDPTADVGASTFRIQMIQRIFAHAFKTLLAYVSEPLEPTDSILATIIPPTEEMEERMALKRDAEVVDLVSDGDSPKKKSKKQTQREKKQQSKKEKKQAVKRKNQRKKDERRKMREERKERRQSH
ncbi:hypothetical protein ACHAXT_004176 [Thalassiosira profunda]